jgi:hypothetical protein
MIKTHIVTIPEDGITFVFQGEESEVIPALAKHLNMEYDELNEEMEQQSREINWDTVTQEELTSTGFFIR